MSKILDIVKLIEKNPITRLSKDYQNKLINKIKTKFTEGQQQLFVSSFFCYLNHNSKNEFIIDLNNIWKWVGFSRKDPAKRLLEKDFIKDVDYKILLHKSVEQDENYHGGHNKEQILMTINTFKKLCLKADTKKADDIHDYYISLEEILQETLNEETNELREQLIIKETKIKQNDIQNKVNLKLNKHQILIDKGKGKRCIYVSEIEENKYIKIGMTKDIVNRNITLNKTFGNSIFLEVFETDNYKEVEENILEDKLVFKNLYRGKINGHTSKEIILLSITFNYEQFLNIVKSYLSKTYFFTPEQLLEKQKLDLEKQKLEYNMLSNILNNELHSEQVKHLLKDIVVDILPNYINSIKLPTNANNIEKKKETDNIDNKNNIIQQAINTEDNILEPVFKKSNGKKIQKIDPNNLNNIVKIYNCIGQLLRSPENEGFMKSRIQDAIKRNIIYKEFRWNYVNPNNDPNLSDILPTIEIKHKNTGIVCKLNMTKTEIINTYPNKTILAKELEHNIRTVRRIVDNEELIGEYYYILYSKCPKELIDNYKKPIIKHNPSYAKQIKRINTKTNEITLFKSLCELNTKMSMSNPNILKAIKNKTIYKGYLWEFN